MHSGYILQHCLHDSWTLFTPSATCASGSRIFFTCLHDQSVMMDKGTVNAVDLYDYIRLIVLALSECADVRPDSTPLLMCRVWIKDRENWSTALDHSSNNRLYRNGGTSEQVLAISYIL